MHLGWILDLYHKPGQMVVWLKKTDGKCVKLTDKWKTRIHVGGDYRELIDLACKSYIENSIFVDKFERPGDIEKSRVLEVVVENDEEAAKLASFAASSSFSTTTSRTRDFSMSPGRSNLSTKIEFSM